MDFGVFFVAKLISGFCFLLEWRWWEEVEGEADDGGGGVLYTVSSSADSDSEILLELTLEESGEESDEKIKNLEVGFSGRQYALVPEGMWLRALKRWVTNCFFPRISFSIFQEVVVVTCRYCFIEI